MSGGPSTWFQGTTRPDGDRVGPDSVWTRVAVGLVSLAVFPLATLVAAVWFALYLYARLRWWWPAVVGVVWGFVGLVLVGSPVEWLTGHLSTTVNVVTVLLPGSEAGGFSGWWAENGWSWLGQQVWFAGFAGGLIASALAGWAWVRRPKWETRMLRPGPVLRARAKRTAKAIAAGAEAPSDGVTVGVALDRRDPRFAGGYPGAPYGRRAVLRDSEGAGHCLIVGGSGSGKALDVGTLIPLPGGGFRAMGELQVGDYVLDEFLQPTEVVGAFDPMVGRPCFEVCFSDGSTVVADEEHLWRVRLRRGGVDATGGPWVVLCTAQLAGDELHEPAAGGVWEVPEVRDAARDVVVYPARAIVRVRPVESRTVRCIAVDSVNRVFLAGTGMVPTHNTTTMLIGARDVIRRGHGLVVVDCKGGPDVPDQIADWAAEYGRRFHHWSMFDAREPYDGPADGPGFYDPISRGDASRRKDLLIGSQRWDVEYYKTVIGDYLQTLFKVVDLVPAPEKDTFQDVADLLSPSALIERASVLPREQYPELMMTLQRIGEMAESERSGINNMYARLNTLTSSIAGPWLRRDPRGHDNINLENVARRGEVVVFSLDTSNYEETSALLAGLIVQDLKTVSSSLREDPPEAPMHVCIDEFSAVDATNIYGLLAKARDARMPVTLATQALADLKRREQHFDSQVVGIVSSFLIHRANSEEDARVYAGLSGLDTRMTHRVAMENTSGMLGGMGAAAATGTGFLQEEERYRVNPGVFQMLQQGQCVMIAKIPEDRFISPVQVIREDPAAASGKHSPPLHPFPRTVDPDPVPLADNAVTGEWAGDTAGGVFSGEPPSHGPLGRDTVGFPGGGEHAAYPTPSIAQAPRQGWAPPISTASTATGPDREHGPVAGAPLPAVRPDNAKKATSSKQPSTPAGKPGVPQRPGQVSRPAVASPPAERSPAGTPMPTTAHQPQEPDQWGTV